MTRAFSSSGQQQAAAQLGSLAQGPLPRSRGLRGLAGHHQPSSCPTRAVSAIFRGWHGMSRWSASRRWAPAGCLPQRLQNEPGTAKAPGCCAGPHRGGLPGSDALCAGLQLQLRDLSLARFLRGHVAPVQAVAYSPDPRYLASGASDGVVMVRHLRCCVLRSGQTQLLAAPASPAAQRDQHGCQGGQLTAAVRRSGAPTPRADPGRCISTRCGCPPAACSAWRAV